MNRFTCCCRVRQSRVPLLVSLIFRMFVLRWGCRWIFLTLIFRLRRSRSRETWDRALCLSRCRWCWCLHYFCCYIVLGLCWCTKMVRKPFTWSSEEYKDNNWIELALKISVVLPQTIFHLSTFNEFCLTTSPYNPTLNHHSQQKALCLFYS